MLLDLSPAPTKILARENPRARPRVRTSTQTPARTLTPARTRTPTKTPKRNRRGQQAVAPAGMRTGTLTPRRLHPRHSLQARCVLYSEFSTPISLSLSLSRSLARSRPFFLARSLSLSLPNSGADFLCFALTYFAFPLKGVRCIVGRFRSWRVVQWPFFRLHLHPLPPLSQGDLGLPVTLEWTLVVQSLCTGSEAVLRFGQPVEQVSEWVRLNRWGYRENQALGRPAAWE